MSPTNVLLTLSILLVHSAAFVLVRNTPPAVLHDYEDINFNSILFLTQNQRMPDPYKQLHYDDVRVISREQAEQLTIRTRSIGTAVARNLSSITSAYNGSPVWTFDPDFAYFGCYVVTQTSYVPRLACDIFVSAYKRGGRSYGEIKKCTYSGGSDIEKCDFPTEWTEVEKLRFDVRPTEQLNFVLNVVASLLILLGISSFSPAATAGLYVDDLEATYACVVGYANGGTGLCDDCAFGYQKALDGRCVRSH